MGRPKLPDRVTLTVRISPELMQRIDAAVLDLQLGGESALTKGALVERLLISGVVQVEEARRDKRQLLLATL